MEPKPWTLPPHWIDPGIAFRLDVSCDEYKANLDYGIMEFAAQEHELWIKVHSGYNLDTFLGDMAALMMWGRSQELAVWAVDTDSAAKWKLMRNEHFDQMIEDRLQGRVAKLSVEVVEKEGYQYFKDGVNWSSQAGPSGVRRDTASNASHADRQAGPSNAGTQAGPSHAASQAGPFHADGTCTSPGLEGVGDTCTSPADIPEAEPEAVVVDWTTLTILPDNDKDGDATVLVDEDVVFEAMGFKAADERAAAEEREQAIPSIPPEVEQVMREAAMNVDDEEPTEPMMEWDRDNPDMDVGTVYPSMREFRLVVRQHAIVNEFELGTEKSDKERFKGFCRAAGCPWIIRARTQKDGAVRIQINKWSHKCASRSRVKDSCTMASQAWIAERAIPLMKQKRDMGAAEVTKILEDKYKIELNYQTVWYGRQRAADKLFGKWDYSFDWLCRFKAEVEMRSPGSVIEIDTIQIGDKVHFHRFFCAFEGSIKGFLEGCRPYISIDSTALNGMWNGHMPAALALDGHNWMFPLAFGLFDSETKDNWTWFMEQLGKAVGVVPHLAVCTDACKGLEAGVKHVFSWVEQRECFRHLMENMKKRFTGDVHGENTWPAARSYYAGKHKYFMDKMLAATPGVEQWLSEHHNLLWARSKFSTAIKCDYINNNLAESWNAWIKPFKDLPVHCLVDAIKEKGVTLFENRDMIARALTGVTLPAVVHQLNAASKGLGHLKVIKGILGQAEVSECYKDQEVRR